MTVSMYKQDVSASIAMHLGTIYIESSFLSGLHHVVNAVFVNMLFETLLHHVADIAISYRF